MHVAYCTLILTAGSTETYNLGIIAGDTLPIIKIIFPEHVNAQRFGITPPFDFLDNQRQLLKCIDREVVS